jgi:hypothetical protein
MDRPDEPGPSWQAYRDELNVSAVPTVPRSATQADHDGQPWPTTLTAPFPRLPDADESLPRQLRAYLVGRAGRQLHLQPRTRAVRVGTH